MKKKIKTLPLKSLCPLLLCAALSGSLCACGTASAPSAPSGSGTAQNDTAGEAAPQTEQDTGTDTGGDTISGKEDGQTAEDTISGEKDGQTTEDNDTDANTLPEGASAADPEIDTTVSTFPSPVRIEMRSEEEELTADDGTLLCTTSYACPVVSIEDNADAAEKINADIRSRIDSFLADTEIEEWAMEGYEYHISEELDYAFLSYYDDMSFGVQRSDSNVISFTITYYTFSGGAHGNYSTQGVNYNTRTGELIAFSDLSDDADAFHADTLAYNQDLAGTEVYQMRMFSEDLLAGVSLESVLYADDAWYLSASGLTFISDPYALGPYVAGTIEFVIPYADLADMGFAAGYAYADRTVRELLNDADAAFDLNGDGAEDTILFSPETVVNEDESYSTISHLIINDVDFSDRDDDAAGQQLNGKIWSELALFDLNVEDDYTELVLLSGESIGDNYVYNSHFFRYTKDGRLLYLGKAAGNVLDPSVTFSALE